jgi:hypothetical protein
VGPTCACLAPSSGSQGHTGWQLRIENMQGWCSHLPWLKIGLCPQCACSTCQLPCLWLPRWRDGRQNEREKRKQETVVLGKVGGDGKMVLILCVGLVFFFPCFFCSCLTFLKCFKKKKSKLQALTGNPQGVRGRNLRLLSLICLQGIVPSPSSSRP